MLRKSFFDHRTPSRDKLIGFGFSKDGEGYSYSTEIVGGQLIMRVTVMPDGRVSAEITDSATVEPYTLHLIDDAVGAFVGAVRADYERVLENISERCFDGNPYGNDCLRAIINYALEKYGDEPQFLWSDDPTSFVFRRKDNAKWYGLVMTVPRNKLGLEGGEKVGIFDFRMDPAVADSVIDEKKYFRGYHMNKKHWATVCLDGSVSLEEIFGRIDESYNIAGKR